MITINQKPKINLVKQMSLLWLLVVTLFAHSTYAEEQLPIAQIIALDNQRTHLSLSTQQMLSCTTLMSIDQPNPFDHQPCQLQKHTSHYREPSQKTTWISITLLNTSDHAIDRWLTTGHQLIKQIRIWQSNHDTAQSLGLDVSTDKKMRQYTKPVTVIHLEANEQITLLIGYSSSTYISTQVDFWSPENYIENEIQQRSIITLTLGALGLAIFLTLIAYLWRREGVYLFFLGALVTETILLMAQSGIWLNGYIFGIFSTTLKPYLLTPILVTAILNVLFYSLFIHKVRQLQKIKWITAKHYAMFFLIVLSVFFIVKGIDSVSIFLGSPTQQLPIEIGAWLLLFNTPIVLVFIILENQQLVHKIHQGKQENKAKAKFLREVNHEIRAPLNRVLIQALEIERPSLREKIIQNCRHIMLTIDEALSYSNTLHPIAKVDQTVLTWQAFIQLLSQSAQEIIDRTYREHHNHFEFRDQANLYPWIMIDERRVMQIMDNLITNAARYTKNGKIQLILRIKKKERTEKLLTTKIADIAVDAYSELILIIRDTGSGISQEEQLRIFEPFVRGVAGLKSGCHGVGMGLAIVKQLVDQLQGTIQLSSEVGKGTQITLMLPIYPATEPQHHAYQQAHSTDLTTPDAEAMKHLAALIQQGGISDIIRWANQLTTINPEFTGFCQQIIQSAVKGDMSRLRQLARLSDKGS